MMIMMQERLCFILLVVISYLELSQSFQTSLCWEKSSQQQGRTKTLNRAAGIKSQQYFPLALQQQRKYHRQKLLSLSLSSSSSSLDEETTVTKSSGESSSISGVATSNNDDDIESFPSWDYKKIEQYCWKSSMSPIVLFDGNCGLCNGSVNMVIDMDTDNIFRFCSLQSKIGQSLLVSHGKKADDLSSIGLIIPDDNGGDKDRNNDNMITSKAYWKTEAVMRVAQKLDGAPEWVGLTSKFLAPLTPSFAREFLYHIVSKNRYRFAGEVYDQCRIDFDGTLSTKFLEDPVEDCRDEMEKNCKFKP